MFNFQSKAGMLNLKNNKKIGQILVDESIITQEELDICLAAQKTERNMKLGEIICNNPKTKNKVTEKQIIDCLIIQHPELKFTDFAEFKLDAQTVKLLPEEFCRKNNLLVISVSKTNAIIAMNNPLSKTLTEQVKAVIKRPVLDIYIATKKSILDNLDKFTANTDKTNSLIDAIEDGAKNNNDANVIVDNSEINKLFQDIFSSAAKQKASDIHIESFPEYEIRFRIDGVMRVQPAFNMSEKVGNLLINKLKLMAQNAGSNINPSEKRRPQDGKFGYSVGDNKIDVRLSTTPTKYNEEVVLRLLNKNATSLEVDKLGMPEHILEIVKEKLGQGQGMILVTGPTGSGKTTTLYSAMNSINEPSVKIVTVEDPIEFEIRGLSQRQVNEAIDVTFAQMLRVVLRQDPDIILVGEIRDDETAGIAVKASQTGHLVLSTLHTKTAQETPRRLNKMGISQMDLTELDVVLAQRLVALNCPFCTTDDEPTEKQLIYFKGQILKRNITPPDFSSFKFKKGCGCDKCSNSGILGRRPVYEMLNVDADMKKALQDNNTMTEFDNLAEKQMSENNMVLEALKLIQDGKCSLDQLKSVL